MAALDKLTTLASPSLVSEQPYQVAGNLPPAPQLLAPTGRTLALDRVDKAAEALKNVGKGRGGSLPAAPQLILTPKG